MKILRRIEFNSPVILTFAIASFGALLLNYLTKGYSNALFFSVYRSTPLSPFFWIRLIGHVFGHGNLQHYSGNMMLILLLGPMLEEKYGSRSLVIIMAVTAVATGIVNIVLFPNIVLLGASGIVFMMMFLSSVTGIQRGKIPLTLIIVAVIYIGQELISGITLKDNISHLTHILGGICGGGFGLLIRRNPSINN